MAATAAPADPVPEARVSPTPRSQKRTSIASGRDRTRTNSTFVLRGKKGWHSIAAPIRCQSRRPGRASKNRLQWGLPMETQVTGKVRPATVRG